MSVKAPTLAGPLVPTSGWPCFVGEKRKKTWDTIRTPNGSHQKSFTRKHKAKHVFSSVNPFTQPPITQRVETQPGLRHLPPMAAAIANGGYRMFGISLCDISLFCAHWNRNIQIQPRFFVISVNRHRSDKSEKSYIKGEALVFDCIQS